MAVAPSSDALRAPARPPDPPPTTKKSNRIAASEAILRQITVCLMRGDSDRRSEKSELKYNLSTLSTLNQQSACECR
ncbi:hypothetical protein DPEC_G00017900 [Dallia pectoralis]|uniref:Uncharacterized protein n=1 Tax=Dallia pectoralis TaxID=75939 RepID=A0ACC2HFI7_DALPE|nr:hypothetical protein DPEC_G00017900 [Dallia pectoralis]